MEFSKRLNTLLICFLMIGSTALSQTTQQEKVTVSDDELGKIITVFQNIQLVNNQGQQEMAKTIESNGLEMERFNELYEASQSPEKEANASTEEKEKYGVIINEIQKTQMELQEQMKDIITKEGFTLERYEQVATALQTDAELQQRIQSRVEKQ